MDILCLIIYSAIGFIEFLILYLLRSKYKINRLSNTVFSILIFLVFATLFNVTKADVLNKNLFMVFIFKFIYEFIYSTYILEEDFFNKSDSNILYYSFLILFGLFLNNAYINKVEKVFLTGEDIRLITWILLIIFIYKFIQDEKVLEKTYHTERLVDESNVLTMFTKLRKKYLNDIKVKDLELELAVYSVMIFNNSKRSALLRSIDNILFKINGHKRKLGIMQVESNHFINDYESIEIVIRDLKKLIGKKNGSGVYEAALSKYIEENNLEVLEIYNTLKNFFKI